MRYFVQLLCLLILWCACKKGIDENVTPEPPPVPPPVKPADSTLSTDSTALHVNASMLSIGNSFNVKYIGNWSISVEPKDTGWISLSSNSGTGVTQVTVRARNLNLSGETRSAVLSVKADGSSKSAALEIFQDAYIFSSWSRRYGGSGDDYFKAVVPTPDLGYIALGNTKSSDKDVTQSFGGEDLWIVKTDQAGNIVWQKSFGYAGQDYPWTIIVVEGGYLVAASSNSPQIGQPGGNHHPWLIKINEHGDVIWQQSYSIKNMGIIGITEIPSGYVLVGQTDEAPLEEKNAVIIKIDKTGTFQWEKRFGGDKNEMFRNVLAADDGGILAFGNRNFSAVDDNTTPNTSDLWLVKTNADGDLQWEKQIGGNSTEYASSITKTSEGGCVVVGWGVSSDVPGYHGGNDVFAARVNGTGDILWKKSYGGSLEEISPVVTSAGSSEFMIATYTGSSDGDITNPVGNIWVCKINADGAIVWDKSENEVGLQFLNAVAAGDDGKFIVAGGALNDSWLFSFD